MALLAAQLSGVACVDDRDDGTKPGAVSERLPALELTDDSKELLLTWIDERGGTHTSVSIGDVPAGSREMVRVITKSGGHGATFYVANLNHKNADGTYAVRSMRRSEWEALVAERRKAYRDKHAPPPPPVASGSAATPMPGKLAPVSSVKAIVYGAVWCKPCHDAERYLKRKGVDVTKHDIEKHPKYAAEMRHKLRKVGMSGGSIPVIDVGGIILRGYSPRALDNAIEKARRGGGTHL